MLTAVKNWIRNLWQGTWSGLHYDVENQQLLSQGLQNARILTNALDYRRPSSVGVEHAFQMTNRSPIRHLVRSMAPKHNAIVRKEIDKMLKAKVTTPSVSALSIPVVIVLKTDRKTRFCVEYRPFHQRMKEDRWPLPKSNKRFDELKERRFLTTVALFSGF